MAKTPTNDISMSKDMIDNIKNYADSIQTLEDFIVAVRKRPGMHIGSIGNKGLINLVREILQNGLDELNKESSPCDRVFLTFDEKSQTTIVEDNGRGIPFGHIDRIFAREYTSSNYTKKLYEYSSGLHGVGAKVTNALSSRFIVESYILGDARKIEYTEGYPWDKGEVKIPNPNNKQGTRITFTPSLEAMGPTSITVDEVYTLVNLILPLCKLGATVVFTGIRNDGQKYTEKLVNDDGIITYFIDNVQAPLIKPIHLFRDNGTIRGDIMFTYNTNITDENGNVIDSSKLFAFCNTCPTTLGTHIDGFYDGICTYLSNYMNKVYLAKTSTTTAAKKKKKTTSTTLKVKFDDVRYGMCAVVSAAHLEPVFDGQSKEKLSNSDVYPFIKTMIIEEMDKWAKENSSDLNKICKYLKDVAEMRTKTDKEKINVTKKYKASALTGLPSNFVAPIGNWKKEPFELIIAEGESAAGAMRNDRDNRIQGYFPIRGKIPGAFSKSRSVFLGNEEVAGIAAIILDGVKDYDINQLGRVPIPVDKIKWDKIIFGTDADSDGDHIDSLLLRYFVMYMPELIMAGKVYKLLPPLYGIVLPGKGTGRYKKHKMRYFIDRWDYIEYLQKEFAKQYTMTTFDNRKLKAEEMIKFFYQNSSYTYELGPVAANHSIPPVLLEDMLIIRDEPFDKFKQKIKKKYRFAEVTSNGNTIIVTGSIDGAIRTVFFNNILINECKRVIDMLDKNESYVYRINGELKGVYEIMSLFNASEPKSVQRYKGLGEMNGPKLYDSTLDPENRTIIQYTMDSALETIEKMKYYNNNMRLLLNDIKVSRFDVMD